MSEAVRAWQKQRISGFQQHFPVYKEETKTIAITAANVAQYFTVTNGSYYFAGSGNVFTSNNGGVNSSEATTTLTAKVDISPYHSAIRTPVNRSTTNSH